MSGPGPSNANDRSLLEQLRSILAFVFDVPTGDVHSGTRLCDLPRWSSLSFIVLMTAVENHFATSPNRDRAWGAVTVGDLLSVIRDSVEPPAAGG